jgi:hypothetical protein
MWERLLCSSIPSFLATNNDKALQLLSERVTLDPATSRLRCAGHIFNLVCTAILLGVNEDLLKKEDWEELCHLKDLLAPIHEVSM